MINRRISEIISYYCSSNEKAILYFESKKDPEVAAFYDGKIEIAFVEALKYDDDCFFEFDSYHKAIRYAEWSFPTRAQMITDYGDDSKFIEVTVYDTAGDIRWTNMNSDQLAVG